MSGRILVWDLPVRAFHWLLALGFASSAIVAKFMGEDSLAFPYHMIIGLTLAFMVILRIVWGLVGSRWARFKSLRLHPRDLVGYFGGVTSGKGQKFVGHNPATSFAMLVMFVLILSIAWTGLQYSNGNEEFEDAHVLLTNVMLIIISGHITGVIIHAFRHRDRIVPSLIHGYKEGEPADAIPGPQVVAALGFVALVGYFSGSLVNTYNPVTQSTKWPVSGSPLQLGEGAEGAFEQPSSANEEVDDD